MAGSNTTTMSGLAKEIYPVDLIKNMENLETTLMKEISPGQGLEFSAIDGGSFKFAVKAHGPHGQKMMNELEALPNAYNTRVVQGKSFVKEYAGVLQFSKRELELAKGDATSFANVKTLEMEGLIKNAYKYFNRQLARGDGTGAITLVQGAQSSQTVIEVDDATGFQIGMVIDIFDAATDLIKQVDSAVVQDIDLLSSPNTITIDQTVTCDDNGIIYLAGVNDNASSDGKEMIGIPLAVDDGTAAATFQNITRTGAGEVPNYRGITLDASSGALSEALINRLMSRARRYGGADSDFVKFNDVYFYMSEEQWRAYVSLSVSQFRFDLGQAGDLNKAYTIRECMGKRCVLDTDCDMDRVYIIKKTAMKMATATELDWEEDLGGTSLKWLSGYNQGIMLLYALKQMYVEAPREMAAIINLASVAI